MKLVTARSVALAGAIAVGALGEAFVCGSVQASPAPSCTPAPGAYAFACTGSLADYATLTLQVGGKTVSLSTDGFQGWISNSTPSLSLGGPNGDNTNYLVGVYSGASYNDYFGFNLSQLGPTATVTSAKLTVSSGLINEKLNYTLFGATQLISQLENPSGSTAELYNELEAGPVYDDPILSPNTTDPTKSLTFVLDPIAVSNIDTAIRDQTMFAIAGHADLVSGVLSGSVPEPSTWILMLAGFAGLGFVARRGAARRRATTSAGRSPL